MCTYLSKYIYISRPSIIMIIDNKIMNMDCHLETVLWVSKPSKQVQVCTNNHTYRAITQHLNSSILSLHDKITKHLINYTYI